MVFVLVGMLLIVALPLVPGMIISHRRNARGKVRDTVADLARADDELEERWAAYWHVSDCENLALLVNWDEYVAEQHAIVDRFARVCDEIVKRFTISALVLHADLGSAIGGWSSNIEREASKIYERTHGSLAALRHEITVELAEITNTLWTEDDAAMLREYERELAAS